MIEVEIFRFGRTWRYLISQVKNGKEQPRIMKLGCISEKDAIQEARKMIANITQPLEEIKCIRNKKALSIGMGLVF